MDESGARQKKFNLVEVIVVSLAILLIGLLDEIPLIGPVFDFGFTQFYLGIKGVSGIYQLIMLGSNGITELLSAFGLGWIGDLLDLVVFWIIVGIDWFAPAAVAQKLEEAGQLEQTLEGKGGVGGTAAQEIGSGAKTIEAGAQAGGATAEASVVSAATAAEAEGAAAGAGMQANAPSAGAEDAMMPKEERPVMDTLREELAVPKETQFSPGSSADEESDEEDEDEDLPKAA